MSICEFISAIQLPVLIDKHLIIDKYYISFDKRERIDITIRLPQMSLQQLVYRAHVNIPIHIFVCQQQINVRNIAVLNIMR